MPIATADEGPGLGIFGVRGPKPALTLRDKVAPTHRDKVSLTRLGTTTPTAAPSTFTADAALDTIDEELAFTLSMLRRYDFAAEWATQHEALLRRCDTTGLEQRKFRRALTTAQGKVSAADLALDAIVDLVDLATATATGKDASHPLRRLLFQDRRTSEIKRLRSPLPHRKP